MALLDRLQDVQQVLVATTFATSAAIAVVLLARHGLRAWFGAGVAYRAWMLVPVALASVLLPKASSVDSAFARAAVVVGAPIHGVATSAANLGSDHRMAWLLAWGIGVVCAVAAMAIQQRVFLRHIGRLHRLGDGVWQATATSGLPVAMGFLRPAIVLPADFTARYTADQRALMLAHERTHVARGDLQVNAVVAALRCLYWFNPLLQVGARALRRDQELACDLRVIARHPRARRSYCEAMVNAGLSKPSQLACHWGDGHPLKERITMLMQPVPSRARRIVGSGLVVSLSLLLGVAAWAAQPRSDTVRPTTPASPVVLPMPATPPSPLEALPQVPPLVATTTLPAIAPPPAPTSPTLAPPPAPPAPPTPPAPPAPPQMPQMPQMPAPPYPPQALRQGIDGTVVLLIDVGADGKPTQVVVDHSEPAGVFDATAIATARHWTFNPALEHGKPVAGQVKVPITFEARRATPRPAAQ